MLGVASTYLCTFYLIFAYLPSVVIGNAIRTTATMKILELIQIPSLIPL